MSEQVDRTKMYEAIQDSLGRDSAHDMCELAYRMGHRDARKAAAEMDIALQAQHDELLAAAKEVQALYIDSVFGFGGHSEEAMKILSAAIANAEKDKSGC